jgi:hypothetical protein
VTSKGVKAVSAASKAPYQDQLSSFGDIHKESPGGWTDGNLRDE